MGKADAARDSVGVTSVLSAVAIQNEADECALPDYHQLGVYHSSNRPRAATVQESDGVVV